MALISANLLPNEVVSLIVVETGDPALCCRVCKAWAHAVQEDPLLYVKIFDEWMKNKNIAPFLIYLPEFVPNPNNIEATRLVKLAFGQILAEVKDYMMHTRKKTFSAIYPCFENVQTMKLMSYWDHWHSFSKRHRLPETHPKPLADDPRAKIDQIRGWMKQGFNKEWNGKQINEINLSGAGLLGLPSEFFEQVKEVQSIILCQNNLKSLPPGISQCAQLIQLDLRDNPIQSLPLELRLCPNLECVHLDHMTLKSARIPEEIKHLIPIPEIEECGTGDEACEVEFGSCPIL